MITLEEYKKWVDENIETGDVVDPDVEAKKAQDKYLELTAGMTVTIVEHDWKDHADHMREVCKQVKELDAINLHYFPSFYDFPNGSLDAIITVISKEEITEEFAGILVDLTVNLGAEGS